VRQIPTGFAAVLNVIKQGHEAEVHVELLVAVEEGEAGIIGDEIYCGLLIAA